MLGARICSCVLLAAVWLTSALPGANQSQMHFIKKASKSGNVALERASRLVKALQARAHAEEVNRKQIAEAKLKASEKIECPTGQYLSLIHI